MKSILILLLFFCLGCAAPESSATSDLVGSYTLMEWKGIKPDSSIVYPYGESAQGLIQYDNAGMMSMQLQRSDRTLLGTDDYESLDASTVLEAYKGFFSYYGPYTVDETSGVITHNIDGCKNPDWVGRELKRKYSLKGEQLVIRTDSVIGMDHILTWKRIQ